MTLGSWQYYDHEVGVEDYFSEHGQEPGLWVGSSAAALGLSGMVEDGQLARLFDDGCHPVSGVPLGLPYRHDSKRTVVTGFALSFSPPKSVSLIGAFGGPGVADEVDAAHDAAVRAALTFLDDHAAFSRAGRGGFVQVDTDGFVAAVFRHRTSRAGDPQLHSHVLVANKVLCADGRWRSLDGRELFAFQKAAGMLYNATLRVELSARLGVEWDPVDRNGQADIDGVPHELIELFSKRRHDVERRGAQRIAAAETRLGRTLTDDERAEQFQFATYETRPAKAGHADEAALGGRWRTEAHDGGWDPDVWLPATLRREHTAPVLWVEAAEQAVVAEIVGEISAGRSTWGRAEAAKAAARRLPEGLGIGAEASREWIEATCAAVLAHPEVVTLASPLSADVPAGLRRQDGLPGHERHGATRYTTRETLAREGRVLDVLVDGRHAGVAVADTRKVQAAARLHRLGVDQAGALRRVCEGGERIVCVVGPAGAGKTRMMAAARDVWSGQGIPVRGLAVSAMAAGILADEARIPSETIAKFLHDGRRTGDAAGGIGGGEVLVVDEAAMVATTDLAALAEIVEATDGKLVLVGDPRQLGAVEAGGLFRLLVADSRAAELNQVRRFAHRWEAAASLRLRNGDDSVLEDYDAHGRITGGTREEMLDAAYSTCWSARAAGESVVVVAPDHTTVDALALRARAERVAAGEVEAGGVAVGAQIVGQGDEIITTRNDRRLVTTAGLWVRNGDRWRIDDRRPDGALVVSHLDGFGRVVLPADYTAEHVALAYAVTVHKAQGVTVDRCVLLADTASSGEHLYVGMTRGRLDNRVCVITDAAGTGHGHTRPLEPTEILAAVMRRSSAEVSATERLRIELDHSEDPAVLHRLWEQARTYIELGAGPDRRPELRRLQRLRSELPKLSGPVTANERTVAQFDHAIAVTSRNLTELEARLGELTRRRLLHRPDRPAIDDTNQRIRHAHKDIARLEAGQRAATDRLDDSRRTLRKAERDVARIPDVEAAITRRGEWLIAHAPELEWEANLRARVRGNAEHLDAAPPERGGADPEPEPKLSRFDIDLRTLDLSPHRPATGLDRRLDEALGLTRGRLPIDVPHPPLPGHGIDGPDFGP